MVSRFKIQNLNPRCQGLVDLLLDLCPLAQSSDPGAYQDLEFTAASHQATLLNALVNILAQMEDVPQVLLALSFKIFNIPSFNAPLWCTLKSSCELQLIVLCAVHQGCNWHW